MNTKANFRNWSWPQLDKRRFARMGVLLLLLALPGVVQAQFNYIVTNRTVTITGYTGSGGAVTIPSTIAGLRVTGIGQGAFVNCSSLTSVTIPSSVTSIGTWAFLGCYNISAFTVDTFNPAYSSVDGVLFNKNQTTLLQYPSGRSGNYTVPNSVTYIDGTFGAFRDSYGLTSVTLPNTVSTIGDWSFQECRSLTNLTLPNGVARIGAFAIYGCRSLTTVTIPSSVTSIGDDAFAICTSLVTITIPASVTNLGSHVFRACSGLTEITVDLANPSYASTGGVLFDKSMGNLIEWPGAKAGSYTVPDSVTNIQLNAFDSCTGLTSVTIPNGVATIGDGAFGGCTSLTAVYFQGNAPTLGSQVFSGDNNATVYYLPGTTGWGPTFGGRPTALWLPPLSPQAQTAEVGSRVEFRVSAGDSPTLGYRWFFSATTSLTCTNSVLQLTNVQFSQSGNYTVVVTNAAGAVTSSPAFLSVIAPVERKMVPALMLMGQPGSILNLDFTAALGAAPLWTTFDHVPLTSASQWYFDVSSPRPPRGFYRAWQSGGGAPSALKLNLVPALTLTGAIGSSQRVDYINQFGPTDAWVTLDTVTLTNTSQLYFDTSAIGQPPRLWRIVPVP